MAVSFATDIRELFRENDIEEMKVNGPFDLSKLEDVKKNAKAIHQRLVDGDMPCDAAWSPANIQKFKQWMDDGMQP